MLVSDVAPTVQTPVRRHSRIQKGPPGSSPTGSSFHPPNSLLYRMTARECALAVPLGVLSLQEAYMKLQAILAVTTLVVGLGVGVAAQAKNQTAIGPVLKIAGDSLTIDVGKGKTMQFTTNASTEVKVTAGGAKAQAAKEAGKPGLKITEVVHEVDQVFVRYSDVNGKMVASEVDVRERRPQSAQKGK